MHKIDKVLFQVEYILGFGAAVVCNLIGIALSYHHHLYHHQHYHCYLFFAIIIL